VGKAIAQLLVPHSGLGSAFFQNCLFSRHWGAIESKAKSPAMGDQLTQAETGEFMTNTRTSAHTSLQMMTDSAIESLSACLIALTPQPMPLPIIFTSIVHIAEFISQSWSMWHMTEKLVAIAIAPDGTIAAHAGRALQWQVYGVPDEGDISQAWVLNLTTASSLHEWHIRGDGNRHPLHGVDVAIAASAGEGVRRRLLQRDTELRTTSETRPDQAVAAYRIGNLPEGLPHEAQGCLHH
jgi:hypothetical protein